MAKLLGKTPDRADRTRYVMIRRLVFIGDPLRRHRHRPAPDPRGQHARPGHARLGGDHRRRHRHRRPGADRQPRERRHDRLLAAGAPQRLHQRRRRVRHRGADLAHLHVHPQRRRPARRHPQRGVRQQGGPQLLDGLAGQHGDRRPRAAARRATSSASRQAMLEVGESLAPAPEGKQDTVEVADISGRRRAAAAARLGRRPARAARDWPATCAPPSSAASPATASSARSGPMAATELPGGAGGRGGRRRGRTAGAAADVTGAAVRGGRRQAPRPAAGRGLRGEPPAHPGRRRRRRQPPPHLRRGLRRRRPHRRAAACPSAGASPSAPRSSAAGSARCSTPGRTGTASGTSRSPPAATPTATAAPPSSRCSRCCCATSASLLDGNLLDHRHRHLAALLRRLRVAARTGSCARTSTTRWPAAP